MESGKFGYLHVSRWVSWKFWTILSTRLRTFRDVPKLRQSVEQWRHLQSKKFFLHRIVKFIAVIFFSSLNNLRLRFERWMFSWRQMNSDPSTVIGTIGFTLQKRRQFCLNKTKMFTPRSVPRWFCRVQREGLRNPRFLGSKTGEKLISCNLHVMTLLRPLSTVWNIT